MNVVLPEPKGLLEGRSFVAGLRRTGHADADNGDWLFSHDLRSIVLENVEERSHAAAVVLRAGEQGVESEKELSRAISYKSPPKLRSFGLHLGRNCLDFNVFRYSALQNPWR